MVNLPIAIAKTLRPIHWVKNLSIFAALLFTGDLFDKILFQRTIWAFIAFSLAASATYVFNDILDANHDRLHPIKKNRPIASGELPIPVAFVTYALLLLASLYISLQISPLFSLIVLVYLIIQVAYSLFLKDIIIIDILVIAAGFILRVYAGALIIDAHLSVWFLLCVISLSLFLASGKRRAELGVLASSAGVTRKTLTIYSESLLSSYVTMFANAAWISWALFTFFESPQARTPVWLFLAEISKTVTISKFLMVTIPVAIFGIMRYMSLIFAGRSEAPEKLLLKDLQLMFSVLLWIVLVVVVLYGGVSG